MNESGAAPIGCQSIPRQDELVGYPLRGQEPIDLAELLRKELELTRPDSVASRALGSVDNFGAPHLSEHSGLDWPDYMLASKITRDNSRFSGSGLVNHNLRDLPQARDAIAGSRDGHDPALKYSPAPPNLNGYSSQAQERLTPRRQTALEIAQQYRQQQLRQRQQQSALPTPPNSSSPIWSSSFSPYPSSALSPELLSSMSGVSKLSVPSRSVSLLSDVSQQFRGSATANHILMRHDYELSSSVPTLHVEDSQEVYATSPSLYTLADTVEAYVRDHARRTSNNAALQTFVSRSPGVPRPPSNTFLTAAASRGQTAQNKSALGHAMTTPPSPTSPQQQRGRTLSTQQARSIPLTRLIQRRLSAVPEEDALSQLEEDLPTTSMADVYTRSRTRSLDPGLPVDAQASQLNYLLSPTFSGQHTRAWDVHRNALLDTISSNNTGAVLDLGTGHVVQVKLPVAHTHGQAGPVRGDNRSHRAHGRRENGGEDSSKISEGARGRGQKRGGGRGRGRGGHQGTNRVVNGPERVDGGLMVKS
ncbi:hypothetical protein EVJ58_g570 [Rhodofomes roseus]|uniref:Uncharacterized protein n=1 Tax=Rhodofomes roseus TaxID=34475 RepID=A0A4Y9Z3L0_9APHY|nr:hypothetical protein EVJ58_g570 [Rhodofomes roseus]